MFCYLFYLGFYSIFQGASIGSLFGLSFGLFLALSKMFYGVKPTPLDLGQCDYLDLNSTLVTIATTSDGPCSTLGIHLYNGSTSDYVHVSGMGVDR